METQKKQIQQLVATFIHDMGSVSAAASKLRISRTTLDNIAKGNWESISDEMFLKVGKQLGLNQDQPWTLVQTYDWLTLVTFFDDARTYGNVYAIIGSAGSGKTFTANWYSHNHKNVYHIVCAEYWNRRMFLSEILRQLGRLNTGYTMGEMMEEIINEMLRQDKPLIILDEADKLTDSVLYFFITLYNQLKDKAGIVLMATDFLAKRIQRGYKLNKKGYAEILSRIGRRFIYLRGVNRKEVEAICRANGIDDPVQITEIWNECEGDLRRVERGIHKMHRKREKMVENGQAIQVTN
ncbi:MAG: AAA family ATPase [Acidobacterium ailaaui]|nr:AAA family ATPase [Pseudacidobacterium ailaaui]